MKTYLAWVLAVAVLTGLTGCGKNELKTPELREPVGVQADVTEARMDEVYHVNTYSGEVVPYVEDVYFSVDGRLDQMYVSFGDTVQQGDVLAAMDTEAILQQIENLEKEIAHLLKLGEFSDQKKQLEIETACKELEILEKNGAEERKCAEKELEIEQLELNLEQNLELRNLELQEKQSDLELLQEKVEMNQVTAPFDGTVVYIGDLGKGDSIQAYEPVIYVADDSRLSLSAEYIPEFAVTYTDRIYAKIMDREYELSYVPYSESEYIAMILHDQEMKAEFSFQEPDEFLESGQYAAILVIKSYRENVLTVPVNALYKDGVNYYVYKEEEGQSVRCDVKTGVISSTKAEILEGLEEGDVVYVKD